MSFQCNPGPATRVNMHTYKTLYVCLPSNSDVPALKYIIVKVVPQTCISWLHYHGLKTIEPNSIQ